LLPFVWCVRNFILQLQKGRIHIRQRKKNNDRELTNRKIAASSTKDMLSSLSTHTNYLSWFSMRKWEADGIYYLKSNHSSNYTSHEAISITSVYFSVNKTIFCFGPLLFSPFYWYIFFRFNDDIKSDRWITTVHVTS
jgi:hypothetical protein